MYMFMYMYTACVFVYVHIQCVYLCMYICICMCVLEQTVLLDKIMSSCQIERMELASYDWSNI